jgi:AcrR family transcriptional regulator
MGSILSNKSPRGYSHMKRQNTGSLSPRKKPMQRRSTATVDAIFEATIQVLLSNGFEKTSTVQIAERAGVSVGSLYQYFPNKRSLLAGIVHKHISDVVSATIAACESMHGATIREMCTKTVEVFVDAKTRRPEVSRALYMPAAAIGGDDIVKEQSQRSVHAVHAMLVTASDARFQNPEIVSRVMVSSVIGPTQGAIEGGGDARAFAALKTHLTALCVGYLREVNLAATDRLR